MSEIPHQLFTVADALGSQHVQQGFGDRTAGCQGRARAGADGNIGQQPVTKPGVMKGGLKKTCRTWGLRMVGVYMGISHMYELEISFS